MSNLKPIRHNPDNLFDVIGEQVNKLVPSAGEAAKNYIDGKGLKPLAEVSEIKANAYEKIARIANDNQRLVMEHEQKMYQLETERCRQKADEEKTRAEAQKIKTEAFTNIVIGLEKLNNLGCDVNTELTIKKLIDPN